MFARNWCITETAVYPDAEMVVRTVESGLTKRRAERAVAEWQAASDRNKLLIRASGAKGLPVVVYGAVQS